MQGRAEELEGPALAEVVLPLACGCGICMDIFNAGPENWARVERGYWKMARAVRLNFLMSKC